MEQFKNSIGVILTAVSGVVNVGNIIVWLNENKIFFSISGTILITVLTAIWWLFKIINDNRKSDIELEIRKIELEERKIKCEENRIELEIKKQSKSE